MFRVKRAAISRQSAVLHTLVGARLSVVGSGTDVVGTVRPSTGPFVFASY